MADIPPCDCSMCKHMKAKENAERDSAAIGERLRLADIRIGNLQAALNEAMDLLDRIRHTNGGTDDAEERILRISRGEKP